MTRYSRIYLFLALLLALSSVACNGRINPRRNALPTQAPEAIVPTETNPLPIPVTFTPQVQPAVEAETAVGQPPRSTIAPTKTAVPLPTQEAAPSISAETESLFSDIDSLFNQIDDLNNDDLSDMP